MAWTNETKTSQNIQFISTEALDFLMTEDDNFLITDQSTSWDNLTKSISSWVNPAKAT